MSAKTPEPEAPNSAGAPADNINALKHGRRMRSGLYMARLPKACSWIHRQCGSLRRALETAVEERHGERTVYHDGVIITAVYYQALAQMAAKWLREGTDFSPADRLAHAKETARASGERDKCLRLLGLDKGQHADPWSTIHAEVTNGAQPPADATPTTEATAEPANGQSTPDAPPEPTEGLTDDPK